MTQVKQDEFHQVENFKTCRYIIQNNEGQNVLYGIRIEDTTHMSSEAYNAVLFRIGALIQEHVPGYPAVLSGSMLFRLIDFRDYDRIVDITRFAIISEKLTRE